MDDLQRIHKLWKNEKYMEALAETWELSELYNYAEFTTVEDLDLQNLVFRACREAVGLAWQEFEAEKAQRWIDVHLGKEPPLFLVESEGEDAKSFREQMIRAYLGCANAALETQWTSGTVPLEKLNQLASRTRLSRGFLCDLIHELLPDKARNPQLYRPIVQQSLRALLVSEADSDGIVADLTLELMSEGSGDFYPDPQLAFVYRDDEFVTAEKTARTLTTELWRDDRDVRWQIKLHGGHPADRFEGPSLGLAFTLGLAKLLVSE